MEARKVRPARDVQSFDDRDHLIIFAAALEAHELRRHPLMTNAILQEIVRRERRFDEALIARELRN